MYLIKKDFKFCYAHQLYNSYTELCSSQIHGHNALVEVFITSDVLDDTGMVMDFGKVKDCFKSYFDNILDHSLIMPKSFKPEYLEMLVKFNKRIYIIDENPTAENLAKMIFDYLDGQLKYHLKIPNVKLQKIRFWETDTAYAEYIGE